MEKNDIAWTRKAQVELQMRCIADMCMKLAAVHYELAYCLHDSLVEIQGERTAKLMEYLGDVMNNMDIVEKDDERWGPVFQAAHEMFLKP